MPLQLQAQREAKRVMLLKELGLSVDEVVGGAASEGYRMSSKRVVFGKPGALQLGSYVRGSHRGAAMRGCLVDHPRIRAVADELQDAANQLGIEPYDERTQRGDLRYVWLKTNGERVLATLVTAGEQSRAAEALPERMPQAHGVAWSVQSSTGNALRGEAARPLRGPQALQVTLAGQTREVGPLGFLQPNPAAIEAAYRALVSAPDGSPLKGEHALDLYAGTGVTTALLQDHFARVDPCESYPESAEALGIQPRTAEAFVADQRGPAPDLVIANPPRSGLQHEVVQQLRRLGPERIQVMSCGPKGLARDLDGLTAEGPGSRYQLLQLRAFDSLPQTPHLELVAWLGKHC